MNFPNKIARFLLALRYKIKIKNKKILSSKKPTLFLSNHVSHTDPQILVTQIFRWQKVSPVVENNFYDAPILNTFFKKIRAVRIPETTNFTQKNRESIDRTLREITAKLARGENVLLYPSGQTAGQGLEFLFGKKSTFQILQKFPPNARVVGVRIRGLWGSIFSRAWSGRAPNFFLNVLRSIFYLLANFIFFVPKRHVTLEFEDITEKAKQMSQKSLQEFNKFLENFFNFHGEEKVFFLRHFFFAPKLNKKLPPKIVGSMEHFKSSQKISTKNFDAEIMNFLFTEIRKIRKIDRKNFTPEKNLILDFYFDSLDLAEIISIVQQKFAPSREIKFTEIKTVFDLHQIAIRQNETGKKLPPCNFNSHFSDFLKIPPHCTIPENFLEIFTQNQKEISFFDEIAGNFSRQKFLLKTVAIVQFLQKNFPEKKIGILLPALSVSTLFIAAVQLAGKIPVMFNFTAGKKSFTDCVAVSGVKNIFTAKKFFDTISEKIPANSSANFIFLEDAAKKINFLDKIRAAIKTKFARQFFSRQKFPSTAAILFTSGSENLPKAVPLSQENILENLRACLQVLQIERKENFLGFLPPFHSFGFAVNFILPLCTGAKIAYCPNPLDGEKLRQMISHTKTSLFATSPTFLKNILQKATAKDLSTLKFVISGAEACSEKLKENFQKLTENRGKILEGYGITECSPVLTVNPLEKQKAKSVGKFLPNVEYKICDLKTGKILPTGKIGMILVRGKSIFGGYLDQKISSPFVEIDGKKFYRTGDLGFVDREGFLFLSGREKRFIKIAGEMISLPFLENLLNEKFSNSEENIFAVEGSDQISPPKIVLFSVKKFSLKKVNKFLLSRGISNLSQISEIRFLKEIPVLGSGKVDYQILKKII